MPTSLRRSSSSSSGSTVLLKTPPSDTAASAPRSDAATSRKRWRPENTRPDGLSSQAPAAAEPHRPLRRMALVPATAAPAANLTLLWARYRLDQGIGLPAALASLAPEHREAFIDQVYQQACETVMNRRNKVDDIVQRWQLQDASRVLELQMTVANGYALTAVVSGATLQQALTASGIDHPVCARWVGQNAAVRLLLDGQGMAAVRERIGSPLVDADEDLQRLAASGMASVDVLRGRSPNDVAKQFQLTAPSALEQLKKVASAWNELSFNDRLSVVAFAEKQAVPALKALRNPGPAGLNTVLNRLATTQPLCIGWLKQQHALARAHHGDNVTRIVEQLGLDAAQADMVEKIAQKGIASCRVLRGESSEAVCHELGLSQQTRQSLDGARGQALQEVLESLAANTLQQPSVARATMPAPSPITAPALSPEIAPAVKQPPRSSPVAPEAAAERLRLEITAVSTQALPWLVSGGGRWNDAARHGVDSQRQCQQWLAMNVAIQRVAHHGAPVDTTLKELGFENEGLQITLKQLLLDGTAGAQVLMGNGALYVATEMGLQDDAFARNVLFGLAESIGLQTAEEQARIRHQIGLAQGATHALSNEEAIELAPWAAELGIDHPLCLDWLRLQHAVALTLNGANVADVLRQHSSLEPQRPLLTTLATVGPGWQRVLEGEKPAAVCQALGLGEQALAALRVRQQKALAEGPAAVAIEPVTVVRTATDEPAGAPFQFDNYLVTPLDNP